MSNDDPNNTGNGGGTGAGEVPKWMSSLPDAFKSNETLAQFKDGAPWEKFVSLLGAEKSMITIPGEGAKPEEVTAFWNKVGRPEKADGYAITKPADLPETIQYNPEIEKSFKAFAHENNLTKGQAEKIWSWYFGLAKQGAELDATAKAKAEEQATAEAARVRDEAIGKLKTEWGNKFEPNKEGAIRAFKALCGKDQAANDMIEKAMFDGVKLGDHPTFLKVFHSIFTRIQDDSALFGGGGGGGADTPEALERQQAAAMFPSMNKK